MFIYLHSLVILVIQQLQNILLFFISGDVLENLEPAFEDAIYASFDIFHKNTHSLPEYVYFSWMLEHTFSYLFQ